VYTWCLRDEVKCLDCSAGYDGPVGLDAEAGFDLWSATYDQKPRNVLLFADDQLVAGC
jgi:hypothetical protein